MKKKVVIGVICAFILIILAIVMYTVFGKVTDNPKKSSVSPNKVNSSNEFDIAVEDQYNDILTQFFNLDFLYLLEYDNLARYPSVYKDVIMSVDVRVKKTIEEKDNHYKILVEMPDPYADYKENELVIEGEYKKARFLKNDRLRIYGVFKENEKFNIDGVDKVLPKINVMKVIVADQLGKYVEFDEDDIRKVASEFFETTFTLTKPNYDFSTELGKFYATLPFHYIITLDNNSNARFNKYRFYITGKRIDVATEEDSIYLKRYISKSSDKKNFILSTYTTNNDFLELQSYDKDFKLVWSRQFENAGNYKFDNNNGRIALSIDSDLYIIDEATGKNIAEPIITSKSKTISLLSNGDIILVTEHPKDFLFYINADGTIKWRSSLSTYTGGSNDDIAGIYSVLIANQKIYIGFYLYDFNDSHVAVFDESGKELINTFTSLNS